MALVPNQAYRIRNSRCGRGCGHKFKYSERVFRSKDAGDICVACVTDADLRVEGIAPEVFDDEHADEIRDALAGHP